MAEILKEAAIQVGSGGTAGFVEVCIMHPLDLVKTRLQLQNKIIMKADPQFYTGISDCMAKMYKNEGLGAFWKGIIPPILVETPKRAVKNEKVEFLRKFGIGFVSGTLASCVNIPFDVAKSRIQGPQPQENVIKYRTTFGTIATVYKEEGFAALYKGLLPKVLRLGPGGAIMLLVYEYMHTYLVKKFN